MESQSNGKKIAVEFQTVAGSLKAKLECSPDTLLDNDEAAFYCKVKPNTMKNSRYTGKLGGVDAPAFVKIGRSISYRLDTLCTWRNQFTERTCTRPLANVARIDSKDSQPRSSRSCIDA
ncbi:hypothetical protein OAS69_01260 [Pseudomonadales bacterium]|nr:hypothetical protein [Pseudomonadales bacterium]